MENDRLDNLIDELLEDMPPVQVPTDLSFDAGAIMREAKRREEAEHLERVSVAPLNAKKRSWKKWVAIAAAFAVVAGGLYFGVGAPGQTDPGTHIAETIDDGQIPLAGPDDPATPAQPENPGEPQTQEPEEEDPQVLAQLFLSAYADEAFVKELTDGDRGYGYIVTGHKDVPEGTEFMVYFYESEEERSSYTVDNDKLRYILWKH
ncbi:MAG: hypothetical protein K5981_04630 [Clostridia bacterium]|nr:hypothetical protein [Clostridia bacterium]